MNFRMKHAIGLLAALLVLGFLSVALIHHDLKTLAWLGSFVSFALGTVTVTYEWPSAGTTPPTAAQMNQPGGSNTLVTATVVMQDGDTTGVLTHNMALSAADQAALFPLLGFYYDALETVAPLFTMTIPNGTTPANTVTLGKASGAGTGFTATVWVMRPHTLIR
jgi:hypothetical protein